MVAKESWLFLFAAIGALWATVQLVSKAMGWLPQLTRMSWTLPTAVIICLLLSGLGFYRSLYTVPGYQKDAKQEDVIDQVFVNREVNIDGKYFSRCRFENTTFVIAGTKPYSFINCHFIGSIVIKTNNPMLDALIAFQKATGAMDPKVRYLGKAWDNVEPFRTESPNTKPSP